MGGDAGGGAAAERVKDHVAGVGRGLDDSPQQGEGLLRRIVGALFGCGSDAEAGNVGPHVSDRGFCLVEIVFPVLLAG